ncbi:acyl-CoA carboxylase subunit epsilon [Agreia pratensis]|uniref:Acyl-CoA carboxylase epsilon subunit n=1 Tax=Agreia pratensis TaxID=150121 RepID=A0A1X7IDV5_9MICO|nr:acyl-CoA carboxylase subunit epsilon [Agreia pratensis]SMG12733.1 Acyl-CoA carboxylase epsilon subunit [Agreia pratensis]
MTESTPRHAAAPEPIEFTITTPNLEPEQIAAVTAVLQAAIANTSDVSNEAVAPTVTGWEKSRRDLRTPIHPGAGEWRRAT